jgi:hypothetical protein
VLALFRDTHDPADLRVASRRAFRQAVSECFTTFAVIGAPCPTLLVAGEKESRVRPTNAALAALMPRAEARYAPGLGHCWQRKDPDLHIRMVEAWVTGQPLPSGLRPEPAPTPEMMERVRGAIAATSVDDRRPGMAGESWYLRHKSRIMRDVRFALPHFRRRFVEAYGEDEGGAIAREALRDFEVLLPDLPDIGGDENLDTRNLYLSAAVLAMYRLLRARGASVEEAARLIYLGASDFFRGFPTRWLMRWQGRRLFRRRHVDRVRHAAALSQQRRYPDDWVMQFVPGDGRSYEFGADYTECGVVKYLSREGAPELAPYLCWLDYPRCAAMHVKLTRTETIAQGGQRCDFRFSRGRPVQVEPEFLHA